MIVQRAVPVLTVSDVRTAIEEFQSLMGLDVLMDHGWVATLGAGTAAQFSVISQDATAPVNPTMSLAVPDVDAAYVRVKECGGEIVHPIQDEEWGVRRFFFRTADGHVVNVLSHH